MADFKTKMVDLPSGKKLELRSPTEDDAAALIEFTKAILEDGAGMSALPGEIPSEMDWQQQSIAEFRENPRAVQFAGLVSGRVIGLVNVRPGKRKRQQHACEFGISVAADWRSQGVGRVLLRELISWAQSSPLEKINLLVRADNPRAIKLYKEFGFEEQGRFPKSLKLEDGSYIDDIAMYRFV